jgi:hypothetical protein
VLLLHVVIHFVTMIVVLAPLSIRILPALLALALAHFCIDFAKRWFTLNRPQWRAWPYVVDQILHLVSIILVSGWISSYSTPVAPLLPKPAAVIAAGFLLVTYVTMISERVMLSGKPFYPTGTKSQEWPRLAWRAGMFILLLLGWRMIAFAAAGLALVIPYPTNRDGLRIFFMDLAITLVVALLVVVILGDLR